MSSERRRFLIPRLSTREDTYLGNLFRQETVGGVVALSAAAIAVILANTALSEQYEALRAFKLGPMNLEHWAADGALTIFFFVAGMELKREFVVGSLTRLSDALVPVMAAVFGVLVPAGIYFAVNASSDAGHPGGWAIPAATDIAFALAVLAVVGSNLPTSLRAFLLTLAVVDDLLVIIIIAVFYTESVNFVSFAIALAAMIAFGLLMKYRISSPFVYIPIAVVAWWFLYKSGVHATIAGVVMGLLTRVKPDEGEELAPLERVEHVMTPISAALAVPFFAFMSAGVVIGGGAELVRDPVVIGVVLGLVLGKPLGVFLGAWLATRFTQAELNEDLAWRDIIGVSLLAGIGFTVSLLVSDLSFTGTEREAAKTAVLFGSLIAAVVGALALGHRDRYRFTP